MHKRKFIQNLIINIVFKFYYLKFFMPYLFAHKPLCSKYKKDTIKFFSKIYVCRSCFLFYTGIFLSIIFCIIIKTDIRFLFLLSLIVIISSHPFYYKHYSRFSRDLLRFLLGFSVSSLLINLAPINIYYALTLLCCCFAIKSIYNKYRKKNDLCYNCNKQYSRKACEGYAEQTKALLQIEEKVSDYIMKKEAIC